MTTFPFAELVGLELQRAERYRIFVSVTLLDLSFVDDQAEDDRQESLGDLLKIIKDSVRTIDHVSILSGSQLGLLFPETPRQGAEVVARRITEMIKSHFSKEQGEKSGPVIPLEMASFPDAAGARTIKEMMLEWQAGNQN